MVLYGELGFTSTTEGGRRARPEVTKRRFPLYGPVPPLTICTVSERFNCTTVSSFFLVIAANPAHGLDWHVDCACGSSKRTADLRHVDHRDNAVVVPSTVSKRSATVACEVNDVEVRNIDRRLVSDSKAWVRRDEPDSRIQSSYTEKGGIKDLDEGCGGVCRVESHAKRGVRAPLSVVGAHDIVIEGINVLSLSRIFPRECQWRTYHGSRR